MKKITFYPTLLILLITLFAFKNTLIETDLIQVKGGTFKMGSKTSDTSAELDEQKEHSVTLNTFEISKFEVTVWEWKQFIKANKMKMPIKPSWGWQHPGVVKIRTLMIPALFGVSVSQINLLFDTFIASFLMTGSISWLYYSDRLLEFPLGLFGIAIATVILPALSRNHVNAEGDGFGNTMDWGIKAILLLGLPAMMGLIVLAQPMLMVLFMRGAFTINDVQMASYSLMAYGSGLLSFMLIKVLAPGYYSRQDTKTPVRYGIIAMITNMGFNLIFAIPFGYVGLAIATSMSALLNATLLYRGLHKAGVYRITKPTMVFFLKAVVSTALMVVVLYYLLPTQSQWVEWHLALRAKALIGLIAVGTITYLLGLLALGIRPWSMKRGV